MQKSNHDHSVQWHEIIKSYIDGLQEQDKQGKQEEMQAVLQVAAYKNGMAQANLSLVADATGGDNKQLTKQQKELDRTCKRAESLKLTDKSLAAARQLYQHCVQNQWLSDDVITQTQLQIDQITQEQNFYRLWVSHALLSASGVTPATHIAKITHSSSGGSAMVDGIDDTKAGFLTTSQLASPIYDGAYPNASLSKIAKFLLLSIDDTPLGLLLKQGDYTPLSALFDAEQLRQIGDGFYQKLNAPLAADALIKQVYFPVGADYHQLVILYSSSLIQEIHQRFFVKEVREWRTKIEKQRNADKYHADVLVQIPNVLTFSTVASQPQNVSVNHGSRGGNIRLLCASPPKWQSQLVAPIRHKTMFTDRLLNRMCSENIAGLQQMLMTFDKANISFKEPKRLQGIINWLNAIIDDVFDYTQRLWALPSGWSEQADGCLSDAYQILLDVHRDDEMFVIKKQSDWQAQIVSDFVHWLNGRLRHKDEQFSVNQDHSRIWRRVFADRLREYVEQWG
ncbi:type I-F CRISPR-associated protein Csy1 [Moraxella sp. ZJ142]|uniref:type I-F CRISPR-associated protein Csy1 n=1 Tax=Moraxella marmotae TaxID=3344520 RepID=UPI0035D4422D